MTAINTSFTTLASHSAYLPNSARDYFSDQVDSAMTNFSFWLGGTYHWGIKGGTPPNLYRWEVDDFVNTYAYHTFHQIWIR